MVSKNVMAWFWYGSYSIHRWSPGSDLDAAVLFRRGTSVNDVRERILAHLGREVRLCLRRADPARLICYAGAQHLKVEYALGTEPDQLGWLFGRPLQQRRGSHRRCHGPVGRVIGFTARVAFGGLRCVRCGFTPALNVAVSGCHRCMWWRRASLAQGWIGGRDRRTTERATHNCVKPSLADAEKSPITVKPNA